jgi:hypothetical protein
VVAGVIGSQSMVNPGSPRPGGRPQPRLARLIRSAARRPLCVPIGVRTPGPCVVRCIGTTFAFRIRPASARHKASARPRTIDTQSMHRQ